MVGDIFVIEIPCKECGCRIPDYMNDTEKIEEYQAMIDELCGRMSHSKAAVRGLKMEHDFITKRVWFELEEIGYWIRKNVLTLFVPGSWEHLIPGAGKINLLIIS